MVVSLTVGLAVVSRSVTNLRTATEDTNSKKALSAAEAGIEQAMKSGTSISNNSFGGGSSFTTVVTPLEGDRFLVGGGNPVDVDEGADVWLIPHNGPNGQPNYTTPWSGNLTLYWGESSACQNSAIEAIVVSKSGADFQTQRFAVDPCDARRAVNNFCPGNPNASCSPLSTGQSISGKIFAHSYPIAISNGLVIRVVPLYYSASLGIVGSSALPSQGNKIESVGASGLTNRKVTVYQGYSQLPPEFFPYILFSPR